MHEFPNAIVINRYKQSGLKITSSSSSTSVGQKLEKGLEARKKGWAHLGGVRREPGGPALEKVRSFHQERSKNSNNCQLLKAFPPFPG